MLELNSPEDSRDVYQREKNKVHNDTATGQE